jgi:hypothetical protein
MAKKFALDDAADFDSNLGAYAATLKALDPELSPALTKQLKGKLDRGETLDALLAAITVQVPKP